MAAERLQRRLAAILAADVVGYSRMVEADESGTVARLKSLQSELIMPMIARDGGRVVKLMGDGVLVEFASAVDAVRNAILVSCYAGFLVAREAARQMTARENGAIFFTGASASVKGYANSSAFAMGKFGLRGLCQSLARELQPQNIHIAHFVIDGGILREPDDARAEARGPDGMLHPNAIADTYYAVWRQHRSAWTWEVELRPWVEKF